MLLIAVAFVVGRQPLQARLDLARERVIVGERANGYLTLTNPTGRRSRPLVVEFPVGQGRAAFDLPALGPGATHEEPVRDPDRAPCRARRRAGRRGARRPAGPAAPRGAPEPHGPALRPPAHPARRGLGRRPGPRPRGPDRAEGLRQRRLLPRPARVRRRRRPPPHPLEVQRQDRHAHGPAVRGDPPFAPADAGQARVWRTTPATTSSSLAISIAGSLGTQALADGQRLSAASSHATMPASSAQRFLDGLSGLAYDWQAKRLLEVTRHLGNDELAASVMVLCVGSGVTITEPAPRPAVPARRHPGDRGALHHRSRALGALARRPRRRDDRPPRGARRRGTTGGGMSSASVSGSNRAVMVVEQRRRGARPMPPWWLALVDTVLVVGLGILCAWPLGAAFTGRRWLLAVTVGLVLGVAVGWLSARFRWGPWLTTLAAAASYLAVGSAVALPAKARNGFLPTADSLHDVVVGTVDAWRESLTLPTPLGETGVVIIVPLVTGLVGGLVCAVLLWRSRAPGLAGLVLGLVVVVAAAFGDIQAGGVLVRGIVVTAVAVVWLRWRLLRQVRTRWGRRVLATLVVVGVAGGAAVGLGVLGGASGERVVLRDHVDPPFDPHDYPSPLAKFRYYKKEPVKTGTTLFTVDGLESGTLVRFAVMDRLRRHRVERLRRTGLAARLRHLPPLPQRPGRQRQGHRARLDHDRGLHRSVGAERRRDPRDDPGARRPHGRRGRRRAW
ncbi:hypothetical protein [Nocardioides convexus]|uniref:hypothetical protein n=1 Tax=Nocardioides convexus TaxID=2712224 RepID=UPI002418AA9D|nr:hypothetical protein [Nocardioides convexus]